MKSIGAPCSQRALLSQTRLRFLWRIRFLALSLARFGCTIKRTAAYDEDEGYETYEALARTPVGPPLGTFGQVRESDPEAFNKV